MNNNHPFFILTDTSANLPVQWLQENEVSVLPFSFYIDGEEHTCTDTKAFDGEGFYNAMRGGARVTTSQVTPQRYLDAMRPVLQAGGDILFVGMSSGISGSFRCAQLAREELLAEFPERKIRLVDTKAASLGEGIIVMRAVECRNGGMPLDETTELMKRESANICQIFTVDDLQYLRRGGRLSSVSAVVGTMLQIKPILKGNQDGKIVTAAKVRGRRRSVEELAARYDAYVVDPDKQVVCISHADCATDADLLVELLKRNKPPKEILKVCYEPVTGSHVGPGALALFFAGKPEFRTEP